MHFPLHVSNTFGICKTPAEKKVQEFRISSYPSRHGWYLSRIMLPLYQGREGLTFSMSNYVLRGMFLDLRKQAIIAEFELLSSQ